MVMPKLKMLLETVNDKNRLVGALKKNDLEGAKSAITTIMKSSGVVRTPAQELSMGDTQFAELTKALQDGDIEKAKEVTGIGSAPLRGPFRDFMGPDSDDSEDPYPVSHE